MYEERERPAADQPGAFSFSLSVFLFFFLNESVRMHRGDRGAAELSCVFLAYFVPPFFYHLYLVAFVLRVNCML